MAECLKTFGELSRAEKGELLLAMHEGRCVEALNPDDPTYIWCRWFEFRDNFCYRVKVEPELETIKIFGSGNYWTKDSSPRQSDTHRITFQVVDGSPLCDTITMEEL